MSQDYPPTTENASPSPTIPQNYWKIEKEKQNVTDWQDGGQLQDSNIKDVANNAPANSMSNGPSEPNSTTNASTTVTTNKQGSKVNPASQAPIVAGSQGRNQANGQGGLGLIGNGVASSSSGVNQENGISSNASPGNTGSSSQGSGPPIAVIPANGGGSPNSGGVNTANTGLSGGIPGQTGNALASSGQPGGNQTSIDLSCNFFKQPMPLILIFKGNKGRCKESTIRGHRKNLSPRWDSNPRPSVF